MRPTTIVTRLTKHDDAVKSLLRGAPRLGLALGPASARTGPACKSADGFEILISKEFGAWIMCCLAIHVSLTAKKQHDEFAT